MSCSLAFYFKIAARGKKKKKKINCSTGRSGLKTEMQIWGQSVSLTHNTEQRGVQVPKA